ncbi:MAG: FHA domain-containing serine/threonine-protein kinase [Anaerolineales bacterium]
MTHELIGHTLKDRYYLRVLVGTGGTADVFDAWDNLRAARIAVKILRRDLPNSKYFELFVKEAELLRRLEHPNIVRIYEFDEHKGMYFLVMDWVDGVDLRNHILNEKRPLSLQETSRILGPICSALNYAHKNNVYHCDVKPPNILLHKDGRVLLTDFGVARLSGATGTGGTPPYMAPEQFMGDDTGPYTDIYGLGITLYEMLSGGQLPFRGESPNSTGTTPRERIAWEHIHLPIPPLRSINPNIAAPVERVVTRALDKNPGNRYATTLDLAEAFDQARMAAGPEKKPGNSTAEMMKTIILPFKPVIPPLPVNPPSRPIQQPPIAGSSARPTGPHLYGRSGYLTGQVVNLSKRGAMLIGRGSTNDISLPETSVSRLHASIIITQRGVYIQDEGSSLGTQLNGQTIQPRVPVILKHGDVIQIGYQQVLEFRAKG